MVHLAIRAVATHQSLRDQAAQHRGQQEPFHPHLDQSRDGADGRVGVQRRNHEVAGHRGFHRDLRGLAVAYLAHHDDIRVLTQDRAQTTRKAEVSLGVDLHLSDAVHGVFDRILYRHNVSLPIVQHVETGV